MAETITLKNTIIHQPKWEEEELHPKAKASTVSAHVVPHTKDTMASALTDGDTFGAVTKAPSSKSAPFINSYYQDSSSSYSNDDIANKISVANPSLVSKVSSQVSTQDNPIAAASTGAKPIEDDTKNKPTVANPPMLSKVSTQDNSVAATSTGAKPIETDLKKTQDLFKGHYQEIIDQTKVQPNGQKSTLEQRLEALSRAIDDELNKDDRNFDFLQALVLKLVMLHMRKTARVEQEYKSELGVRIKVQAVKVKDAYASNKQLGVCLTFTALSSLGFLGLAPLVTTAVSAAAASAAVQAGQVASNIASPITNVVASKDNSEKGFYEFELRLMQNKEENANERKRNYGEITKTLKSLFDQIMDNLNKLAATMTQ